MAKKQNTPAKTNDARLVVMMPSEDKRKLQERAGKMRLSASGVARMLIAEFLRKGGER